ncbi:MAG: hypothetical protein OEY34_00165 [Cyclobacteriaceae bacterium]|nr:hypothetical protein [Cyclobacteriaceae bacterium]
MSSTDIFISPSLKFSTNELSESILKSIKCNTFQIKHLDDLKNHTIGEKLFIILDNDDHHTLYKSVVDYLTSIQSEMCIKLLCIKSDIIDCICYSTEMGFRTLKRTNYFNIYTDITQLLEQQLN